jgi:hypothetical protein
LQDGKEGTSYKIGKWKLGSHEPLRDFLYL